MTLTLAFCIGVVAGLRTFTPMAVLLLARGGVWVIAGIPAALAAGLEFMADVRPTTPPRTAPMGLAFRLVSGASAGWMIATLHGSSAGFGALAGVVGAGVGTYGGVAIRIAAIARIGAYPAAIAEDLIAVGLAVAIVTH
jgi:uncharacterized membrane protein